MFFCGSFLFEEKDRMTVAVTRPRVMCRLSDAVGEERFIHEERFVTKVTL